MSEAPWVALFEGRSAGPDRWTRSMTDWLLDRVAAGHPPVQWVGVPVAKPAEARKYQETLWHELGQLAPERLLVIGALALQAARGDRKKPVLSEERGRAQWLQNLAGPVPLMVPTIPTRWVHADPEYWRDFAHDVMKWGTVSAPVDMAYPDYHLPGDEAGLAESLASLAGRAVVSVDVETTGFDPLVDELLSIGIGTDDGPVVIVQRGLLGSEAVKDMVWDALWPDRLNRVVFHNAKFDLKFLARWWGALPDLEESARLGDTMLVSHLLDERPARSKYRRHGLKDLARVMYDVPDYHFDFEDFHARLRAGELEEKDWEELHGYHAMDCRVTASLWRDLVPAAAAESPTLLQVHDNLLMPATVALARAELAGVPVDRQYIASERARLERRIARRHRAMISFLERYDGGEEGDATLKPTAPAQFKDVLVRRFGVLEAKGGTQVLAMANRMAMYRKYAWDATGWGGDRPVDMETPIHWPNTTNAVDNPMATDMTNMHALILALLRVGRRHEARWIAAVLEQRLDMKYLSTYIEGFEQGIGPDGRVHAEFGLAGTLTGRLSSSNPNLHAVPKRGGLLPFRRCVRARDGWVLVEADYSQLELRVAAILSGDRALRDGYDRGFDIHLEVASLMFAKPESEVTDAERYLAKAMDFGVIYGRGAEAIVDDIRDVVQLAEPWTLEQAETFAERFLDGYPGLRDWLGETGEAALRDRYIDTPFGRRRRFIVLQKVKRDPHANSKTGSPRTAGWIRALGVRAYLPEGGIKAKGFADPRRLLRQAVNTPIQSTASDICLAAFTRLSEELDPEVAIPISLVHDSVLVEVREDRVEEVAETMRRVMGDPPIDTRGVPLAVDVKAGMTLADEDMRKVGH